MPIFEPVDDIKKCLNLKELVYCEVKKHRRNFSLVDMGLIVKPKAHALLISKKKIIDLNINVENGYKVQNDETGRAYGRISFKMSGERMKWNGDIDEVVNRINKYTPDNTVILGLGPAKLENKVQSVFEGFAHLLYDKKENPRNLPL